MEGTRYQRRWRVLAWELALLLALFGAIGVAMVPAHWSSIWADREFSGWVVPIANRIGGGQRLYEDGLHLAMPPLPFVILHWVGGGAATWWMESLVNFCLQSLTIVVMYLGLSRTLPRPIPFLAALGAMPIFFSLAKMIAYDSVVQVTVAAIAVSITAHLLSLSTSAASEAPEPQRRLAWLFAAAGATAAAILSKQNTALGAAGGASLLLLVASGGSFWDRSRTFGLYWSAVAMFVFGSTVLLWPYADIGGLVADVFVAGAEPKGGSAELVANLQAYVVQLGEMLTPGRVVASIVLLLLAIPLSFPRRAQPPIEEGSPEPSWHDVVLPECAGLFGAGLGFIAILRVSEPIPGVTTFSPFVGWLAMDVLVVGLVLSALAGAVVLVGRLYAIRPLPREAVSIGALFVVTFAAAVFHSLSTPRFRWTYDNNPLIVVSLAAVFLALRFAVTWRTQGGRSWTAPLALMALAAATQFALWTTIGAQVQGIRRTTEVWPEVPHLAGARMPRNAVGMRELVRVVRRYAPRATDEVLLLPEDPGVAAWFDRPRPRLSSAIVFSDQYWKRYVAADFARLVGDPPAVIVIGPHDFGRRISGLWSGSARGLMAQVEGDLLPRRYTLVDEHPVALGMTVERMEVYVRNDLVPDERP